MAAGAAGLAAARAPRVWAPGRPGVGTPPALAVVRVARGALFLGGVVRFGVGVRLSLMTLVYITLRQPFSSCVL